MKLFSTRKPRSFRRVSIYTDESRDRLQQLVDDVRREQGEAPIQEAPYNPDKFRGTFINFTPRAKKYKESSKKLGWPVAILLIFVLWILLIFLLKGIK
ncbi:MAG: hypothetical protein J1F27_01620 [Prevotellaceae bacterium]|nr:hypothetical protein [Prevotellaceae bacterium]